LYRRAKEFGQYRVVKNKANLLGLGATARGEQASNET